MQTSYDPEADAFYARFAEAGAAVHATNEVAPGVLIDIDAAGRLIGIEVLDVRLREAPASQVTVHPAAAE